MVRCLGCAVVTLALNIYSTMYLVNEASVPIKGTNNDTSQNNDTVALLIFVLSWFPYFLMVLL